MVEIDGDGKFRQEEEFRRVERLNSAESTGKRWMGRTREFAEFQRKG